MVLSIFLHDRFVIHFRNKSKEYSVQIYFDGKVRELKYIQLAPSSRKNIYFKHTKKLAQPKNKHL